MSVAWFVFWMRIAAGMIVTGYIGCKVSWLGGNRYVGPLFTLSFFFGVMLMCIIILGAVFNL